MKKCLYFLLASLTLSTQTLLAEDVGPPPTQQIAPMLVTFAIIALFFYFVVLRPEKRRRKAMEELRNSIKVGDKVIAIGIVGTVQKIEENTVVLRMIDGSKIEVLKGAISEIQTAPSESQEA